MANSQKLLGISLEEWFKYHPPETRLRALKHETVNRTALCMAEIALSEDEDLSSLEELVKLIEVPELKEWAASHIVLYPSDSEFDSVIKIQMLSMIANQAVTVEELKHLK